MYVYCAYTGCLVCAPCLAYIARYLCIRTVCRALHAKHMYCAKRTYIGVGCSALFWLCTLCMLYTCKIAYISLVGGWVVLCCLVCALLTELTYLCYNEFVHLHILIVIGGLGCLAWALCLKVVLLGPCLGCLGSALSWLSPT